MAVKRTASRNWKKAVEMGISLFGKGFKSSKCKTMAKMVVARIILLRNKSEVVIRQMRHDIAMLLESGQDFTARIWLLEQNIWPPKNGTMLDNKRLNDGQACNFFQQDTQIFFFLFLFFCLFILFCTFASPLHLITNMKYGLQQPRLGFGSFQNHGSSQLNSLYPVIPSGNTSVPTN